MRQLYVPLYEGLNVEDLINYAQGQDNIWKFLPDPIEIRKTPKQWLINMIFSLVQDPFAAWVRERIEARNEKVA